MLPPILEIYVVFHPDDGDGKRLAEAILDHFHGTSFTGLIGGAIEVYVRSEGWTAPGRAPRAVPLPGAILANGVPAPHIVATVPVLGNGLAGAVESDVEWQRYVTEIASAPAAAPGRAGVFPFVLHEDSMKRTRLERIIGKFQRVGVPSPTSKPEPIAGLLLRDLSQAIAQLILGAGTRLTVFISHTTTGSGRGYEDVLGLIRMVRAVIADTRLRYFFSASDLQPGDDWRETLVREAARSAMLVLRTDLYASREWCQREMLIAKRNGMPIVILDSLGRGEERGSFLMDHLPRLPVRRKAKAWDIEDIRRGLNLLVDECLKRALWNVQKTIASGRGDLDVSWWAPHAPEPVTLSNWIQIESASGGFSLGVDTLRILHPDPPLGPDEVGALDQLVRIAGHTGLLEVMTPRMLASRGA